MDDWSKFDEKQLPSKANFYHSLTMESITDESMCIVVAKHSAFCVMQKLTINICLIIMT